MSSSTPLVPNFTQIPDVILDAWMAVLSGSEIKCVMYVARRTYGFRRDAATLTARQIAKGMVAADGRQLDSGTGLSERQVRSACDALCATERGGHAVMPWMFRTPAAQPNQPPTYALNLEWRDTNADTLQKLHSAKIAGPDGVDTVPELHSAEIAPCKKFTVHSAKIAGSTVQKLHPPHAGASEGLSPETDRDRQGQTGTDPPEGPPALSLSGVGSETADDVAEPKSRGALTLPRWDPDGFRLFIAAYPRHDAPRDAARAWDSVKPDEASKGRIMAAIAAVKALFSDGKLPYGATRWCKQPGAWLRSERAERYETESAFPGVEGWLDEQDRARRIDAYREEKAAPERAAEAVRQRAAHAADEDAERKREAAVVKAHEDGRIDQIYLEMTEDARAAVDAEALAEARRKYKAQYNLDPNFQRVGGRGLLAGVRREIVGRLPSVHASQDRKELVRG